MSSIIDIDGSRGEGGGQILRTSLALSLVTGRGVCIDRIRASRRRPGLMRQHLACVKAATAIGCAEVEGDEIGSQTVLFRPQTLIGGYHRFAIGGAGSTVLVLQTILPALLVAPEPAIIVVTGGTHNPLAPSADHFERVFAPLLRCMGADVSVALGAYGFMPAGGGELQLEVTPIKTWQRLDLLERGELVEKRARVLLSHIPGRVGERERGALRDGLRWQQQDIVVENVPSTGPGNVVSVEMGDGRVREIVLAFGAHGRRAEEVAADAVEQVREYLAVPAPVGKHLADQLMIPMAMAGGGSFRTQRPSLHARTNAAVIQRFLDVAIDFEEVGDGSWRVTIG